MSNAERQKRYRDSKRNAPSKASVTPDVGRNAPKVTSEDAPESTNADEVVVEHPPRARLVPIPGDVDYVGCCKLAYGGWMVDNSKPPVKDMSVDELLRRLHYTKAWQHSPEHQEVLRRRREAVA